MLVVDGMGQHVSKAYIYFAMAFSAGVEVFNVLARRNREATSAYSPSFSTRMSAIFRTLPLERPSMAGWVYWGRVFHQASDKLIAWTDGTTGQAVGEAEYAALRAAGAFETIREHFTTAADFLVKPVSVEQILAILAGHREGVAIADR